MKQHVYKIKAKNTGGVQKKLKFECFAQIFFNIFKNNKKRFKNKNRGFEPLSYCCN